MPLQIADSAIRAQLAADVKAAWNPAQIHYSPPVTLPNVSSLPEAFIELQGLPAFQRGGDAGMGRVLLRHTYQITLRAAFPASGTIEGEKVTQAQALLDRLTANATYLNEWRHAVGAIRFQTEQLESQEWVYSLSVEFSVQVLTRSYG